MLFTFAMFIIAIVVVIAIHEYGHYITAVKCGIEVEKFFIGFGPTLFSWTGRGGTEFGFKIIPLGGFVKMTGTDEQFFAQPIWKRSAVAFAGPLFNMILAVALFVFIGMAGRSVPAPVVGMVDADSVTAGLLLPGDRILSVEGEAVKTWNEINSVMQRHVGDQVSLNVGSMGDLNIIMLDVPVPVGDELMAAIPEEYMGFYHYDKVTVTGFSRFSTAEESGILIGDLIKTIEKGELTAKVDVIRSGSPITLSIPLGSERMIGIEMERSGGHYENLRLNPIDATIYGVGQAYDMTVLTCKAVWKLVTGSIGHENVSGPIMIADYASKSAEQGIAAFLIFIAIISVNLGVMNLIPLPVLDGGLLAMYAAEAIKGSPLSIPTMERLQYAGVALLVGVMILATYNDVVRYIM